MYYLQEDCLSQWYSWWKKKENVSWTSLSTHFIQLWHVMINTFVSFVILYIVSKKVKKTNNNKKIIYIVWPFCRWVFFLWLLFHDFVFRFLALTSFPLTLFLLYNPLDISIKNITRQERKPACILSWTIPATGQYIRRPLLEHLWSTGLNEKKINLSTMMDRSDDPSQQELLWSYISLLSWGMSTGWIVSVIILVQLFIPTEFVIQNSVQNRKYSSI